MKIIIEGDEKEIAALVLAIQEQRIFQPECGCVNSFAPKTKSQDEVCGSNG